MKALKKVDGLQMNAESIDSIVSRLGNPLEREGAVAELALLGNAAVGPIVSFLLAGPGNEHEPGCLAAEALELIGGEEALDGLFIALLTPIDLRDPVEELRHEAVRDCICHALRRIGERRAVAPLLLALRQYHLVGAAEALAEFKERRALPLLVKLLEDSFKRARVSDSIRKFGKDAFEELLKTIKVKILREDDEVLPSIERRAEAAKLLGLTGNKDAVPALVELLGDDQETVRLEAALSLAGTMRDAIPKKAFAIVESAVHHPDLATRLRVEEALCLAKHKSEAPRNAQNCQRPDTGDRAIR
jgi:HEAT repeat protein